MLPGFIFYGLVRVLGIDLIPMTFGEITIEMWFVCMVIGIVAACLAFLMGDHLKQAYFSSNEPVHSYQGPSPRI